MTLAIRLFQCVFLCIMATYCLLAYLPFTYQQIIQGNLLPWLGVFGRFQPILWWILTVVGRTPRSAADAPVGLVRSLAGSGSRGTRADGGVRPTSIFNGVFARS